MTRALPYSRSSTTFASRSSCPAFEETPEKVPPKGRLQHFLQSSLLSTFKLTEEFVNCCACNATSEIDNCRRQQHMLSSALPKFSSFFLNVHGETALTHGMNSIHQSTVVELCQLWSCYFQVKLSRYVIQVSISRKLNYKILKLASLCRPLPS